MKEYKMPNHEQWLDWLKKSNHDYYVDQYSMWTCKDIIIRGDEGHSIVLEFADNGEFYDMFVDEE